MKNKTKEVIQYTCAVGMLIFGVGLTIASFCTSPAGSVDESVLWVLGQSLIYSGGIFGVTLYINNEIRRQLRNGSE